MKSLIPYDCPVECAQRYDSLFGKCVKFNLDRIVDSDKNAAGMYFSALVFYISGLITYKYVIIPE